MATSNETEPKVMHVQTEERGTIPIKATAVLDYGDSATRYGQNKERAAVDRAR